MLCNSIVIGGVVSNSSISCAPAAALYRDYSRCHATCIVPMLFLCLYWPCIEC